MRGALEPYAEVAFLEPEAFTREAVRDADALIIRTRTNCNQALLDGSKVRLICTATIGFDHIDTALLRNQQPTNHTTKQIVQAARDSIDERLLEW